VLRFILRHCGVLYVLLIPQDSRALHLIVFEQPATITFINGLLGTASGVPCGPCENGPQGGRYGGDRETLCIPIPGL